MILKINKQLINILISLAFLNQNTTKMSKIRKPMMDLKQVIFFHKYIDKY